MVQPTAAESDHVDKANNPRGNLQQAAITDLSVTGNYTTDDTPIETAINSILAVMRLNGDIAD